MRYMILIYGSPGAWKALDPDALNAAHVALQDELRSSRELIDTRELSVDDAKIVRTEGGRPVVTDGPFVEIKEIAAGYYIVECSGMDRATEIAGKLVEAQFAPIEVRRIPSAANP
ncbi:YciI family protein [Allobranchiibius sp. CTAmp26]|uniref:YciI family protein n=1 Tax=Allobranchiibius sp. CTAmp26 TaxID=2815214 RepID=UPI001AA1C289|nr:YciI family protein [Allobranchiibius sp. CTAmp26]MBO1756838.1 hypothetical protein [Allobranchiibius sp. CTAmp26]